MRKYIFILIAGILFIPAITKAQRTRQASCSNQSSAHWYIMPYGGIGTAWYSYDLNATVIGSDGYTYEQAESNTMLTYFAGIQALYRFPAINLGLGGEWQGFNGEMTIGPSTADVNMYYFKGYGRIEVPMYSDSFNDFGAYANVGALFPNNVTGDDPKIGMFIDLGLYYNLIINKSSSFFFGLGYQQVGFESTIGQAVSKHKQNEARLTLGYRFWF